MDPERVVLVAVAVLLVIGVSLIVEKIAMRYFRGAWEGLTKEACKKKAFHIWLVELFVAIFIAVGIFVAYRMGAQSIIDRITNEYLRSAFFLGLFMPTWTLHSVLRAARRYIKEKFGSC